MRRMVLILLGCLWGIQAVAVTNTNLVVFAQLNVTPEKFKNKSVVYSEEYRGFMTAFPSYIEQSGFKPDKWFLLDVGDARLPVMFRKKAEAATLVAKIKPGSVVRVEGRVREFRVEARRGVMPNYYVEADVVTLVSEPPAGAAMVPRDREMRRLKRQGGMSAPGANRQ